GLVSGVGGGPPAGASTANTGPAMCMVARSDVTIPFMGLDTSCRFVHLDHPGRYATSVQTASARASAMPGRRSNEEHGGIAPGPGTAVAFGHMARHQATGGCRVAFWLTPIGWSRGPAERALRSRRCRHARAGWLNVVDRE